MRLTPNDFMYWFSDQMDLSARQVLLGDIVSRASLFPGENVNFTIPYEDGVEVHFTARMSIKDRTALSRMKKALKSRVLTTQPALWFDGSIREKGAICMIDRKPVGLIIVRDVVHIEAGVEEFDNIIDTKLFKH